jgi:16S rRNA (guanine527-N7)-methyltransferase
MDLPNSMISENLGGYGFSPTASECDLIRCYVSMLLRWNGQISLTSVTDPVEILRFHFGESLYGIGAGIVGNGRLADVGSGAGFPGVALALANPKLQVSLIEPNLKKSVFLSEVKRELRVSNVEVLRLRMEEFVGSSLDYVTARAVGQFEDFLEFSRRVLTPSGKAVLWVGVADARGLISNNPEWQWAEPRLIPRSQQRCILVAMPE